MTSAGEVEQFAYCPHNWLLARGGVDPHDVGSERGMEEHRHLGEAQQAAERGKRDYRDGMTWSFRILAVASSIAFLALELAFLRAHPYHIYFLVVSLVLLSSSSGLLVVALEAQRRYKAVQHEHGLVPGRLVASDLAGPGPLLTDSEWDLKGRPDSLIETGSGLVPVETKTGQTPERPFPNHRLQLACYLRLVEVTTGKPPAYGLLTYPDGAFRVAWDDALRTELKTTLERIAEARQTGRADRDHLHAGRCRGCARRNACDQRLA